MAYPSKPWYHGQLHEIINGKQFQYDSDSRLWVRVSQSVSDTQLDSELAKVQLERDSDILNMTDVNISGVTTYNNVEYFNSNTMKFNQLYLGNSTGNYFTIGEYQKVLTVTPSSNNENYLVMGKITAQKGSNLHVVSFDVAVRSNTLPDLSWSTKFSESYTQQLIKPLLWTKETATAGFIIAFEVLDNTIYGNVTVDLAVVPRAAGHKSNVTINSSLSSEQLTIDSGYTNNEMNLVHSINSNQDTLIRVPGPYANDSAACNANIPVGFMYYESCGNVRVRLS